MSDIKLCFLQVTSPEIYGYSKYSSELNKQYCTIHGYDYIEASAINTDEYSPSWSKIFHSIDILKSGKYTHVFFLDADAVVINRNKKLEEVINKMIAPIAFSENGWNGGDLINAGSFIANVNAISILQDSLELVNAEMTIKKKQFPWEQSVITKLHEQGKLIDVFPMNEINSYWLYNIESNDKQFVYHFMARPLSEKIEIAKKLFEKYK